jgi:hypothetical protein
VARARHTNPIDLEVSLSVSRRLGVFAAATLTILVVLSTGQSVGAAPTWAPAATAAIHPGVQTVTAGAQCTSNFVFTDGVDVYIGQAAHCSGTGGNTATDGCTSGSLPLGTPVSVGGASKPGTLVYNSWLTMQQVTHERDSETCAYNDLAIVKLDPADYAKVNPSIPHWGGPTATSAPLPASGDDVYTYGNSSLRFGVTTLSPKKGTLISNTPGGWSHTVYTATPGIPGDSGSAFLDKNGNALGVLSTVEIAPLAGSNGVGDVGKEVAYMQAHSSFSSLQIVLGTEPFTP